MRCSSAARSSDSLNFCGCRSAVCGLRSALGRLPSICDFFWWGHRGFTHTLSLALNTRAPLSPRDIFLRYHRNSHCITTPTPTTPNQRKHSRPCFSHALIASSPAHNRCSFSEPLVPSASIPSLGASDQPPHPVAIYLGNDRDTVVFMSLLSSTIPRPSVNSPFARRQKPPFSVMHRSCT